MQPAQVVGYATSTVKHATLDNLKLLVVQPTLVDGESPDGPPLIAVDRLGAGVGDSVIIDSDGSLIKEAFGVQNSPVRWSVLGIIDQKHQ